MQVIEMNREKLCNDLNLGRIWASLVALKMVGAYWLVVVVERCRWRKWKWRFGSEPDPQMVRAWKLNRKWQSCVT